MEPRTWTGVARICAGDAGRTDGHRGAGSGRGQVHREAAHTCLPPAASHTCVVARAGPRGGAPRRRHAPAGGRGRCARPWHRHQAAPSQKSHVRAPQGAHAAAQTRRAKGLCSRGSEGHLRRRPLGGASGLITRAGPLSVTAPGSREWHPARDIPPCVPSWVFAGLGWSFRLRVSLGCWRFSVQLFLQSAEEA